MLNMRKILMIGGFVVTVLAIGTGLYFLFFRAESKEEIQPITGEPQTSITGELPTSGLAQPKETTPTGEEITEPGVLPQAQTISASPITQTEATEITLSDDGSSLQFYDSDNGLFYKAGADGSLTPLSDKQFFAVESAIWSADKNQAVLEYPDGSNILYNFNTEEQTTLPRHWEDFGFSPDGGKIIAKSMGDDENSRWLITSDADGSNAKIIASLGNNANKVQVSWSPNDQVVGFSRTGPIENNFMSQTVYLIGQNEENFRSLKVKGFNFKAKWSEEGDRILYSVTDPENGYRPTLWAVDAAGDEIGRNTVKINLDTWVDKCVITSGYKAYCAVPKILDEGAGLEPGVAELSDDIIYYVNLQTGTATFVGEPDEDFNINQISVSEDEKTLYFTDKLSGALRKMDINQ